MGWGLMMKAEDTPSRDIPRRRPHRPVPGVPAFSPGPLASWRARKASSPHYYKGGQRYSSKLSLDANRLWQPRTKIHSL